MESEIEQQEEGLKDRRTAGRKRRQRRTGAGVSESKRGIKTERSAGGVYFSVSKRHRQQAVRGRKQTGEQDGRKTNDRDDGRCVEGGGGGGKRESSEERGRRGGECERRNHGLRVWGSRG